VKIKAQKQIFKILRYSSKTQGSCGVCFIFSAVAAIESLTYIKTNKSYVLSEQYVMDCMSTYLKINNDACNGGQPDYVSVVKVKKNIKKNSLKVFNFAISRRGLPLSSSYPYTGVDKRKCPSKTIISDAAIKSFTTLATNDEDKIVCRLMKSPMSVAVFVNSSFLRYSSGIYNDVASCGPNMVLNHALLMGES
jgi:KDEL-tailed cysteine endopeptidase